jgi:diaminopimelate decarboxylase
VDAPDAEGPPAGPAMIAGALCSHHEVLHPRAELPELSEGDVLLFRRVGAYNQSQSTRLGDLRPAVVARDAGRWRLCARRESVDDLIATDVGARSGSEMPAPTA